VFDAVCARPGSGAGASFVTSRDLWSLKAIARSRLESGDPIGRALAEKLDRCVVLPPGALVSGVVTLGSRVMLGIGGRPAQPRVLVAAEEDHAFPRLALPVATPLGVAVLGLVAGSETLVRRGDGSAEEVRILAVTDRPTAGREVTSPQDAGAARGTAARLAPVGALPPERGR
jgi:regulator of nucleoside diphosphate kinase